MENWMSFSGNDQRFAVDNGRWKCADLPMKHGDFPSLCKRLQEGTWIWWRGKIKILFAQGRGTLGVVRDFFSAFSKGKWNGDKDNWKFEILNLAIQLFSKLGLEDGPQVSSSCHVQPIRIIIIILTRCIPNFFGAPLRTPIQSSLRKRLEKTGPPSDVWFLSPSYYTCIYLDSKFTYTSQATDTHHKPNIVPNVRWYLYDFIFISTHISWIDAFESMVNP